MSGADPHELYRVAATRGDRGKRTVFYGYCRCGYGIRASASVASVEAKHARHRAQATNREDGTDGN